MVDFMIVFIIGVGFDIVKGVFESIIVVGVRVYKVVNVEVYRMVFFVSIVFLVIVLICVCCLFNIDNMLFGKVVLMLYKGKKDEKCVM